MTKTTFILAGGNDRTSQDYGPHLSEEIAKHVTNPKILTCFFSWSEETWSGKSKVWKEWLSDNLSQPFTHDYAKPESFLEQIDAADIIYFYGGDTKLLLNTLPDTDKLKKHMEGKVVIGSSAGANMLSKHFWSSRKGEAGVGRGIVDINVMVHYGAPDVEGYKRTLEDWQREEGEFQKRIGDQAVTHLPEGQFIVIEKEII